MSSAVQDLTDEQLVHQVLSTEHELVRAKFAHSQQQLEDTSQLARLRKQIARLKTAARAREIEQGLTKDALINTHRATYTPDAKASEDEGGEESGGFLSGIVDKLTGKE